MFHYSIMRKHDNKIKRILVCDTNLKTKDQNFLLRFSPHILKKFLCSNHQLVEKPGYMKSFPENCMFQVFFFFLYWNMQFYYYFTEKLSFFQELCYFKRFAAQVQFYQTQGLHIFPRGSSSDIIMEANEKNITHKSAEALY